MVETFESSESLDGRGSGCRIWNTTGVTQVRFSEFRRFRQPDTCARVAEATAGHRRHLDNPTATKKKKKPNQTQQKKKPNNWNSNELKFGWMTRETGVAPPGCRSLSASSWWSYFISKSATDGIVTGCQPTGKWFLNGNEMNWLGQMEWKWTDGSWRWQRRAFSPGVRCLSSLAFFLSFFQWRILFGKELFEAIICLLGYLGPLLRDNHLLHLFLLLLLLLLLPLPHTPPAISTESLLTIPCRFHWEWFNTNRDSIKLATPHCNTWPIHSNQTKTKPKETIPWLKCDYK